MMLRRSEGAIPAQPSPKRRIIACRESLHCWRLPPRYRITATSYPDLPLAEARRDAKRVQGELISTVMLPGSLPKLSFDEARERFLKDSAKRTKPKTHEEYERLLKKHFAYKTTLSEITRQDIMRDVSALSAKPSIEQHAFVAIRTMMNWCVRHGLLHASPVPPLRYSTKSRSRILTDHELNVVWERAGQVGYPYGNQLAQRSSTSYRWQ